MSKGFRFSDDAENEHLASTILAVVNGFAGDRHAQLEYVIDTVKSLRKKTELAERALDNMRKRYEDWRPMSEPPTTPNREWTYYEFFTPGTDEDENPDTWRTATWVDRPKRATHWCLIRTPNGPWFGSLATIDN